MAPRRFLFRVEASPGIGLGHLQRCLSLAAALRERGVESVFVVNEDAVIRQRLTTDGIRVEGLEGAVPGSPTDVSRTLDVAGRTACDTVIVDSYAIQAESLARLRDDGLRVVAIDDLARHPFPCHVVVNGGAHAHELVYTSSSGDTMFLLGLRYTLLRPELWNPPRRILRETVARVLVTLGGSDPLNLMPELLRVVDRLPGEFVMDVIVGPFFETRTELGHVAASCRHAVQLHDAPSSLHDVMQAADLAISGGGQTLYALAATGTPTIAIPLATNQESQVRTLRALGAIVAVPVDREGRRADQAAHAVAQLVQDPQARQRMSHMGQHLVDGRGALRVAEALCDGLSNAATTTASATRLQG